MEGFRKTSVSLQSSYYDYFENEYNNKISELVDKLNNLDYTPQWPDDIKDYYLWRAKLAEIFQYLVLNCEIDNDYLLPENRKGDGALCLTYEYNGISKENSLAKSITKYGPILCGKGVCKGLSMAFIDIASKVGIKCELVEGKHVSFDHGWVVVLDEKDNALKHIDVFGGITQKNTVNQWNYFLLSTEELLSLSEKYSGFDESLKIAESRLKYRFNPLSRNDGQRIKNR